jgi:dipeptidyl-peptidase-4
VEYPELAAQTKGFTAGSPRSVTVTEDGARVVFLRSGATADSPARLWVRGRRAPGRARTG